MNANKNLKQKLLCYFQSFERVVVQNILHGQPPSLCEALQSVSRWKVIQVSLAWCSLISAFTVLMAILKAKYLIYIQ